VHLKGSITALTTPFSESGLIDLNAWRAQIDIQLNSGTSAIVVAGSTGEAAALSDAEFSQLIELASIRVSAKVPILAGTGHSSTARTIEQTKIASRRGANVALVVTPPYVRPTQAGLVAHYLAVAEASEIPIILYNVPGRTGCDLLPDTVSKLCSHPNIIGFKESIGNESRWDALYPLSSPGFSLLSGDDHTFARAIAKGAQGVISVASNAVPATIAKICTFLADRNLDEAQALDHSLLKFYDFLGIEPNPIPIKAIMQILGYGQGVRLPLLPLSKQYRELAQEMAYMCKTIEQSI
jgi:4-hydroxy-tetrahydrodipicolinate synthase